MAATAKVASPTVERLAKTAGNLNGLHTSKNEAVTAYQRFAQVENALHDLVLTNNHLRQVMDLLLENMIRGLSKATHSNAAVKMYQTYVRAVPDGSEQGDVLSLDLGGTNFRVLLIRLKGSDVSMKSKIFIVPQQLMLGTGAQLFDHIVDCIEKFMTELGIHDKKLPLGFTFSFPCRQVGLDKAILTTWTKGFNCSGVEGHDIVKLLHEAMDRRDDVNVKCLAVINDTVGALMSCAHSDKNCAIGIILGTGTNACYFEDLNNVELWDEDKNEPRQVIINTEWGAFGDDGCLDFIRTEFDRDIDEHSINPRKQLFEKMISGMYMGETVRLCLVKLVKLGLLFQKDTFPELNTRGRFYTKFVSEIESDVNDFSNTEQALGELGVYSYSVEDCHIIKYVCSLVSRRAAFLASAGLATLLNRMDRPQVTIGVDGSLYRFHPHFHQLMMLKIAELVKPSIKFKLMLSFDGSGKGAAIVASVAHRIKKRKSGVDPLEQKKSSTTK